MKFINFMNRLILSTLLIFVLWNCSGKEEKPADSGNPTNSSPTGIGPIKKIELGSSIDSAMAEKGQKIYDLKCSACHKFEEKVVGPALKDVTKRRTPEWIMNMILNPVEMTQKDPVAQELLATHLTQMTFQNISETEAREILEYFRQKDK